MKSTTLLMEDHQHILRVLKVLEVMVARAQSGSMPEADDVKDVAEFLEGFGDRFHQGREESVLFPALLQDRGQRHYQELCTIIFQHNRHRFLVEGLQESTLTGSVKDFVYCSRRLVDVLREHIREEEAKLFPLVNATLSEAADTGVALGMREHDQDWQQEKMPELLRRIERVESKYPVNQAARVQTA